MLSALLRRRLSLHSVFADHRRLTFHPKRRTQLQGPDGIPFRAFFLCVRRLLMNNLPGRRS
jgi:hypothetical protein